MSRYRSALACFAMLASLAVVGGARADEPGASIVVRGSAANAFSTVVSEGTRPRDTPDAAALLEGVAGVHVRRSGGEGGLATMSIRGAASNQVGIVLAGVPLTGAADPSLDLGTLPLWPGATARVYRTFAPAALGGGYLGGVVAFEPFESARQSRTEVYGGGGSFGAARLRMADVHVSRAASLDPTSSDWSVASGVSASRSDGDFMYLDPSTGEDRRRNNNGFVQAAGVAQIRRDAGPWTVIATTLLQARRSDVAGPFYAPTRMTRLARERGLISIETRRVDDGGRWIGRAWGRVERVRDDDPLGELGAPGTSRQRTNAGGAAFGRSFQPTPRLVVDVRADASLERADTARADLTSSDWRRGSVGASIDASWRGPGGFTFVAAGRAGARADSGGAGEASREILPAAHVGVEKELLLLPGGTGELLVAAHFGTLSRAPSFLELLGDGGTFAPSPGLRTERAVAADAGLRADGRIAGAIYEAEVVGFVSQTSDLIVVSRTGFQTFRAQNVGEALAGGVEASASLRKAPFALVATYTHLETEDRTEIASTRGKPLPGRPADDVTVDLALSAGPLTVRYGIDVVSSTTLDRLGTLVLPTRALHNAGARLKIPGSSELTLIAEVYNLFDHRISEVAYESERSSTPFPVSDFLAYPLPGRRFSFAARYHVP